MSDAAFTFDPDITFAPGNKMVLTGTVEPTVRNLQIYDDTGGVPDITIKPNGTWSATYSFDPNQTTTDSFKAEYNDASGKAQTTYDEQSFVYLGIKGNPYTASAEYLQKNEVDDKMYSASGSLEYQIATTNSTMTETGDQANTQFVFVNDPAYDSVVQKITNFHVDWHSHDTVLLPHADFANMAALLRDTTMSGGNAVIHDPNNTTTLTLMGVTKTEMKAHPHDFAFNGSGQL